MLTSEDKERLVDDLLGTKTSEFRDSEGKLSADARLKQYLFLVISACSSFPELFYPFATKLVNTVKADLSSAVSLCTTLIDDISALSNDIRKGINTAPLAAAVQSLSLMSSSVPVSGDPSYRKYKRSISLFLSENREFLRDDGTGSISRTAEEAFDDLVSHTGELRSLIDTIILNCTKLSGASTDFDAVGWSNLLATQSSSRAKEKILFSWNDLYWYGRKKVGDALYTVIASESVMNGLLDTPRSRTSVKWSGTVVPSTPYTLPEVVGTVSAPFSPAAGDLLNYSVNGTAYSVSLSPFPGAVPYHIFLPGTSYTITAGEDALYILIGATTYRFPSVGVLPPGVRTTAQLAVDLLTPAVPNWTAISVPGKGVMLCTSLVPGVTPTVVNGYSPIPGLYEYQSAHELLNVKLDSPLTNSISLPEAEILYSSPNLKFTYDSVSSYRVRICTDNALVVYTDYVSITSNCPSLGLVIQTSLPTSTTLERSDSLGRVLAGDILSIPGGAYPIEKVTEDEIRVGTYIPYGSYAATIYAPEVASYSGVEDIVSTFLSDLEELDVIEGQLGKLELLGTQIPKISTRAALTLFCQSLSTLLSDLITSLTIYVGRRDPTCEDLLASLDAAGYERASFLLRSCRFQDFTELTPASACNEGGVVLALTGIERSLPSDPCLAPALGRAKPILSENTLNEH